jgi:hypothetical protein
MRKAGVLSVGTPLACEDRLLRWISALVVFVLVAVATTADVDCGAAYTNFVERLAHRVHGLSASQLATIHRKALRIFDAVRPATWITRSSCFAGLSANLANTPRVPARRTREEKRILAEGIRALAIQASG